MLDFNIHKCVHLIRRSWIWMTWLVLVLTACNREGLGSFAGNSSLASIITNNGKLYTSRLDGSGIQLIEDDVNLIFGTSLSPTGDQIVLMEENTNNIIAMDSQFGSPTILFQASNAPGILTFIPSGDVLYYFREDERSTFLVLDPSLASVKNSASRLDQVFLSQTFFKPKWGTQGTEFIMRPYRSEQLSIVTVNGAQAELYSLNVDGLSGPISLGRRVAPDLQGVFAGRNHLDITSAVLSADGRKLVVRTELDEPKLYSLYAIDLDDNSQFLPPLVSEWEKRPVYSISPDGQRVVFDCPDEGGSVCMYDFESGKRSVLIKAASQPLWVQNPDGFID